MPPVSTAGSPSSTSVTLCHLWVTRASFGVASFGVASPGAALPGLLRGTRVPTRRTAPDRRAGEEAGDTSIAPSSGGSNCSAATHF